jgi:hypothetical protein
MRSRLHQWAGARYVYFSNRPFGVKRFQTIHRRKPLSSRNWLWDSFFTTGLLRRAEAAPPIYITLRAGYALTASGSVTQRRDCSLTAMAQQQARRDLD